ncbi:SAV_2336 N-terminal domain-related protein [Streptomyces sp. NPDC051211]|uniref:SAV_2336 N-terminal domain-related protein n=1 Tax=Streptomyces sp. NPDC051211 TaxID=3154643 RepID=UPI00344C1E54
MPDPLARVLDALVGLLPPDCHDSALLADVLWLAAASVEPAEPGNDAPQPAPDESAAAGTPPAPEPPPAEKAPARHTAPDDPDEWHDGAHHGPYGLYENLPGEFDDAHDTPVTVAAGRALPQAVELGRSLRPFMRRFPRGRRTGLDLAATIDSYTRDGELLPVVRPLPEPWFDVLLVIDTHLSMEVWQGAVQEFASLLENSGAFRRVQRWHLSTEPHPDVTDARGRVVNSRSVTAPDGRRLVLVVSDCAASAWYGNEVWQLLRDWACQSSVSIASPLPSRLWHRTALDLPAVRVRSRLPGARNTTLAVTVPPHLRAVLSEGTTYVAVPTLTLTAHSLNRWAQGLVRGSPEGYEAVLVTPFGAPDDPFAETADDCTDRSADEAAGGPAPRPGGVGPAEAFIRTASAPAVRLAGLCSAFRRLSLPLIQLIRQEVVPEATTSDVAELLMSNVLDISAPHDDARTITFKESARAPLARTAGRHDAWLVLDALSRYIAKRVRLPGQGLNAVAALDTDELPETLRPFAYASEELVAALRIGSPSGRTGPDDGGSGQGGPQGQGVRPFLPDPLRSAALLIGAAAVDDEGGEADAAAPVLEELSALLTSREGWDLPAERCVQLIGAGAARIRATLREVAAMADDALLVWYVGHGNARSEAPDTWVLGAGGETLRPDELLGELDVAHLMVVEDGCSAKQSVRLAETRGPRRGVTWLTYEPAPGEGPPALTAHVVRAIAEGIPQAPALLTVDRLVQAAARSSREGWSLRSTLLEHPDGIVPALVRNRAAAPPPRRAAPDASVTRVLAHVREELRLEEAGEESAASAERVLEVLLRYLAVRIRNPRPDRTPPDGDQRGSFPAELAAFLGSYGVTVSEGADFPLVCDAQQTHGATAVPVEVLNFSDASRWIRPSPVYDPLFTISPTTAFAVLLVLESGRDTRRRTLAERVGVTRNADLCVVTLRFPGTPTVPGRSRNAEGTQLAGVRKAIAEFCATAAEVGMWQRSRAEFQRALIFARGIIPADLSDPQILSVQPDLTGLPLSPPGTAGETRLPARLELAGLMPTRHLPTWNTTVLSGAASDSYAFVSVELSVVLGFRWDDAAPPTVELQYLEAAADPEA